ncbi:hypothetical protein [Pseudofrankia sp. BMG5.36]|uniref:hypothetical protein n=1 Tax=Pseudofrankia sp. BMG5.36 TaxID=1834512 RepID=UPI0018E34A94|nr:hypothetical protein [Pseudofrankia sp. BMG5.36]
MPKRSRRDGEPAAPPRADTPASGLTAQERKAAERRARYQRKRRIIRTGQVLMAVGVVVALVHWLAHLETFGGQPSGLVDLVAGYPAAAVVFLVGAVAAGQRQ